MFNELFEDVKRFGKKPQGKTNLLKEILGKSEFRDHIIKDIDTIPENDLKMMVAKNYTIIFKDYTDYIKLFMNEKFLKVLIEVVSKVNLTVQEKVTCNSIIYEYLILLETNNNPSIKFALISLSKVVNKELVNILLSNRLSGELASCIAFTRYSSLDEKVNIKRINFLLSQQCIEYATMKNLYRILFSNLILLFTYTMFDTYQTIEEWMTTEFIQNHNNISRIVLELLEEAPFDAIRVVLSSYANDFSMLHRSDKSSVRFSLREYTIDYPRVRQMICILDSQGIYVP